MSTSKKPADDREEDSGLHDIRNLASSTKARLSSRRSTQNPTVSEDDILASSSAGWKAVALPEPAKMISLPSLAELPSAVEIEKNDKVARAEAKAAAAAAKADAKRAKSEPTPVVADAPSTATAAAVPAITPIGSRITAKPSGGKGKTIAIVGTLMAAAAGVAIFLVVNNKNQDASHSASVADTAAKKETVMPELAAPPAPKPAPVVEPIAPAAEQVAVAAPAVEEEKAPVKAAEKKDKVHKVEIRDDRPAPKETPKVEKKEEPKAVTKGGEDGEPSFDALLKEAGVNDQKKAEKPKLDKKDLSGGDFKNGMNAVSGKARGCYKGTQGTAKFKVAISPSGSVSGVTMKGDFAGKPEGSCVEAAVKSASFPPWDGAPKSFEYSYLLSD